MLKQLILELDPSDISSSLSVAVSSSSPESVVVSTEPLGLLPSRPSEKIEFILSRFNAIDRFLVATTGNFINGLLDRFGGGVTDDFWISFWGNGLNSGSVNLGAMVGLLGVLILLDEFGCFDEPVSSCSDGVTLALFGDGDLSSLFSNPSICFIAINPYEKQCHNRDKLTRVKLTFFFFPRFFARANSYDTTSCKDLRPFLLNLYNSLILDFNSFSLPKLSNNCN